MLVIECPKRSADSASLDNETYAYYAGYSLSFAERLIKNLPFNADPIILDPWNGSGTTTLAASRNGLRSIGSDLNPVMVVVAKARMLRNTTTPSIEPLWAKIRVKAKAPPLAFDIQADPLRDWLTSEAVATFRRVEHSIRSYLVGDFTTELVDSALIDNMSDLAAFFYVTLFRVVRQIMSPFKTTNPTWLRRPRIEAEKVSLSMTQLVHLIEKEMQQEIISQKVYASPNIHPRVLSELTVCSSEYLKQKDNSVDLILTSPPYCTRIDYAVATSAELAVLGFRKKTNFSALRHSLMGTTTVPTMAPTILPEFGKTCISLLNEINRHRSVASSTYYLKNHVHYFSSLQKSIREIARVLKPHAIATFVVQDSVYKDIHNDLPTIISEMGHALGLTVFQRDDFRLGASISNINSRSRRYKPQGFRPTESVISFHKFN